MSSYSGHCLCKNIHYEINAQPLMTALCHCNDCRRASAAAAVGWALFSEASFKITQGELKSYASSAEAQRHFCPNCGSQIAYTASFLPGMIDVTLGSLSDPNALPPSLHMWHASKLHWLNTSDELPRHDGLPPFE